MCINEVKIHFYTFFIFNTFIHLYFMCINEVKMYYGINMLNRLINTSKLINKTYEPRFTKLSILLCLSRTTKIRLWKDLHFLKSSFFLEKIDIQFEYRYINHRRLLVVSKCHSHMGFHLTLKLFTSVPWLGDETREQSGGSW